MTSFADFADILNRVGSKICKRSHRKRQKRPNRELRKKSTNPYPPFRRPPGSITMGFVESSSLRYGLSDKDLSS